MDKRHFQWAQRTLITYSCRATCPYLRKEIFIEGNVLCVLQAGIHVREEPIVRKTPCWLMCSHEGVTLQKVMAYSSLHSSLLSAQTYITSLKNRKINHHKLSVMLMNTMWYVQSLNICITKFLKWEYKTVRMKRRWCMETGIFWAVMKVDTFGCFHRHLNSKTQHWNWNVYPSFFLHIAVLSQHLLRKTVWKTLSVFSCDVTVRTNRITPCC